MTENSTVSNDGVNTAPREVKKSWLAQLSLAIPIVIGVFSCWLIAELYAIWPSYWCLIFIDSCKVVWGDFWGVIGSISEPLIGLIISFSGLIKQRADKRKSKYSFFYSTFDDYKTAIYIWNKSGETVTFDFKYFNHDGFLGEKKSLEIDPYSLELFKIAELQDTPSVGSSQCVGELTFDTSSDLIAPQLRVKDLHTGDTKAIAMQ